MKRLLILNVLLLAIIVALVVQVFSLWWRADAETETVAPRESKAQRPELPSVARRPAPPDIATHIAEHDVFDVSRSEEKVSAVATPAPPPQALDLILIGITFASGGREALFRDQTQPKPLWLREGEEHKGYKISRIESRSVVLRAPTGDEMTLMINVDKGKNPGAPAPGPGGVATSPTPVVPTPPPRPRPTRVRVTTTPAPDIKEKIERLREEARRRRQRPPRMEPEAEGK